MVHKRKKKGVHSSSSSGVAQKTTKNKSDLKKKTHLRKLSRRLKTPVQVQNFLKKFHYNKKDTLRSAWACLNAREAHCMEAAFLAAALLEYHGYPPLVVSMESKDSLDHVIFVYRSNSGWGSVAFSRDRGLMGRKPKFRTIRDLVWSYFDSYIDHTGRITAYQLANLDDSKSNWRYSNKSVWKAERFLVELPHRKLKSSNQRYRRVFRRYQEFGPILNGAFWL